MDTQNEAMRASKDHEIIANTSQLLKERQSDVQLELQDARSILKSAQAAEPSPRTIRSKAIQKMERMARIENLDKKIKKIKENGRQLVIED